MILDWEVPEEWHIKDSYIIILKPVLNLLNSSPQHVDYDYNYPI